MPVTHLKPLSFEILWDSSSPILYFVTVWCYIILWRSDAIYLKKHLDGSISRPTNNQINEPLSYLLSSESHLEAANQVECQSPIWSFCQSIKCCSKRKMLLCIVLDPWDVPQEFPLHPEFCGNLVKSIAVFGGTEDAKRCLHIRHKEVQIWKCLGILALALQSRDTRCVRDLSTENSKSVKILSKLNVQIFIWT